MDPAAAAAAGEKRRSGRGHIEGTPSKPLDNRRTNSGPNRGGSLGMQRAQAAILKGIGAQQANLLESRTITSNSTLKVAGLKLSKAAGNADGGLESLLAFLERKAKAHDKNPNREVKITKVCLPPSRGCFEGLCTVAVSLFMPTANIESTGNPLYHTMIHPKVFNTLLTSN
jgi:hypothetical protein